MRFGVIVPEGWTGEYDGWDPLDAWRRTTEVAREAERLGFESIWLFDHVPTRSPRPCDVARRIGVAGSDAPGAPRGSPGADVVAGDGRGGQSALAAR
jgi:alkanesulfonate monooxygenase SsuD/methylene tetrahydromethanopterin reductase-like flavin-dependent oxidoreductase (luciferase family)